MKKALSIILSICMLLSITAGLDFSAYALSESGQCGENVTYTFDSTIGLLTISGNGEMYSYNNTSSSSNYYSNNPFYNQTSIKSIVINSGITSIGDYAFYGCSGLISVTLPYNITSISRLAFCKCSGLTSVSIPESVTRICESAFYGCSGLTSVSIPENVTCIDRCAFYRCTGFSGISIPKNVTSIGEAAFSGCSGITSIVVDSENTVYDSRNNCNAIIATNSKELVVGCVNTLIPNGIKTIGNSAFQYCVGLTSIDIPNSVIEIGDSAFSNCSELASIIIPESVITIGDGAFFRCDKLLSIVIPEGVTSVGADAFFYCSALKNIVIPNSVTSIGNYAFDYCSGLTNVVYKGTKSQWNNISVGSNNNYLTNAHKRFYIESLQGSCGDSVNYSYTGTNGIGVLTISGTGDMAGYSSADLSPFYDLCIDYVVIKNGVTIIGANAFSGSSAITSVNIPDSVKVINNFAFQNCCCIKNVSIPESVEFIGLSAFGGCIELTSFVMPNSVTRTNGSVFENCISLISVEISNGLSKIESGMFSGCRRLTNVIIPDGVTSIGYRAFWNCERLSEVTIGDNVTSIGDYVFDNCCDLKEVRFGTAVESIGNHAFYGCNRIERVYLFSKQMDSTQNLVVQLPKSATLYASDDTDAELYCNALGVVFVSLEDIECELNGHDYEIARKESTCTEDGMITYACKVCGYSYSETIEATGHNYIVDHNVPPSCTAAGSKTYTCTICGDRYTESIPATGHTVVTVEAVAPTCTEDGHTEGSQCSVCGLVITPTRVVKATGHSWNAGIVTTAPTCTSEGVKTYTCTTCGATQTATIEKTDHTIVIDKAVPATCTKTGLTQGSHCSVCGKVIVAQTVTQAQHTYFKTLVAPTCSSMGYRMYTCEDCGDSYIDRYYDKVDHDFKEGEKYCIFGCGTINPDFECEHNWEIKLRNEATCISAGIQVSECGLCGEQKTEVLEILEHTFVEEKYDATPNAQGYTKYACPVCSYAYVTDITPYASDASVLESAITEAHYYSRSKFSEPQIQFIIDEAESHRELSETNASQAEYDYAVGEILTAIYSVDELAQYEAVSIDDNNEVSLKNGDEEATVSFEDNINEYSAPLDVNGDGIVNAKDFAWLIKNS